MQLDKEMKDYMDRVMEEISTENSESLMAVDADIDSRNVAIRYFKK